MQQLKHGGSCVGVAPWPDDREAAVCFMVDDLTNGWIDCCAGSEMVFRKRKATA